MATAASPMASLGLSVFLGLVAGAAPTGNPTSATSAAVATPVALTTQTGGEQSQIQFTRNWKARLPPETPELRALRTAESQLFPELGVAELSVEPLPDQQAQASASEAPDSAWLEDRNLAREPERTWLDGLNRPDLPVSAHPRVAKYIRYFARTGEGRKTFRKWLRRSGLYRELFRGQLARNAMPQSLQALAFIESGLWPTAVSQAGAAGLWQFMPHTARAYGLLVEKDYDERRGIWKSTEAAVALLKDLHEQLGSWNLAMAAYNCGYQAIIDRVDDAGTSDFWELSQTDGGLPRETQLYVPKIQAVAIILENLEFFGFDDVEVSSPIDAVALSVPPGVRLSLIARAAGTSERRIRDLNPEFRSGITPDRGSDVEVHIPSSGLRRAQAMLPRLVDRDGKDEEIDTLVSKEFDWGSDDYDGTGLSRLEKTVSPDRSSRLEDHENEPSARNRVLGGSVEEDRERQAAERARVNRTQDRPARVQRSAKSSQGKKDNKPELVLYRVTPGDTLSTIAAAHHASTSLLARLNGLDDPNKILWGSTVRIPKSR